MKHALFSKLDAKRLLPLAGLLFASFHASAFDCVENGTGVVDKPAIDIGELAIPANVPDKTKVWESNPITVTAYCDNNTKSNFQDFVTFYFNPKSKSLGQGLKLGVTYEGKDLEQNGQGLQVPGGGPVYKKGSGTPTFKVVTVTFRLYIRVDGNRQRQVTIKEPMSLLSFSSMAQVGSIFAQMQKTLSIHSQV